MKISLCCIKLLSITKCIDGTMHAGVGGNRGKPPTFKIFINTWKVIISNQ